MCVAGASWQGVPLAEVSSFRAELGKMTTGRKAEKIPQVAIYYNISYFWIHNYTGVIKCLWTCVRDSIFTPSAKVCWR